MHVLKTITYLRRKNAINYSYLTIIFPLLTQLEYNNVICGEGICNTKKYTKI